MEGTNGTILSDELLARCRERAPVYDRENSFFTEDFEELREAGYLRMAVPKEMGGLGMNLAEAMQETRRLAYHAPATALALNMHVYWTGLVADMHRAGDTSVDWLLEEAGAGEIFAAGHSESGNDMPVLLSTTRAEPVEGGYRFTGKKSFGSLTPVWTRLGIHGVDTSDAEAPKIVHAFMPRDAQGYSIKKVWDTMGMRATQSEDTILEDVFVPDRYVARIVPAGAAGVDAFVLGVFAWALTGFANVYCGIARRAFDLTLATVKEKGSLALTRSMAHHPAVQHGVAQMAMEIEAMEPHIEKLASDWSTGADHGPVWPAKICAAKYRCVEGAWKVVDTAMDISGGFGMFRKSELERLFRDARAGRFHPSNAALTTEFVAKTMLGINPDEAPRWG
jgi:alkylation response protein AidB-like acyl-CoA dehydrogenase